MPQPAPLTYHALKKSKHSQVPDHQLPLLSIFRGSQPSQPVLPQLHFTSFHDAPVVTHKHLTSTHFAHMFPTPLLSVGATLHENLRQLRFKFKFLKYHHSAFLTELKSLFKLSTWSAVHKEFIVYPWYPSTRISWTLEFRSTASPRTKHSFLQSCCIRVRLHT